jgi:hypothetical protein
MASCTESIKKQWAEAFYLYQGVFAALFALVAVIATKALFE